MFPYGHRLHRLSHWTSMQFLTLLCMSFKTGQIKPSRTWLTPHLSTHPSTDTACSIPGIAYTNRRDPVPKEPVLGV